MGAESYQPYNPNASTFVLIPGPIDWEKKDEFDRLMEESRREAMRPKSYRGGRQPKKPRNRKDRKARRYR